MTNTIYIHQPEKAFSFTRLPNFLFEAPTFKPLSNEAKVLYAFILRRTELSRKNGWADDCGRIYLYYPICEVVDLLHCGRQKAVNTLRELQYAGLVEIQKQGCGKPNRIFPKSYEAVPNTDFKKSGSGTPEEKAYAWTIAQVKSILKEETYIGHSVHNKQTNISFKNKKKVRKPKEEWYRVENTHEAIISEDVFRQVQEQICNRRRRQKNGTTQIFSGLVKCADCGWSLAYGMNSQNKNPYAHYHCSKYGQGLHQCSMHYIRYDVLYAYVLSRLQYWSVLAQQDGDKLLKRLLNASDKERNTARKRQTAELKKAEKRKAEVDTLFAKMYEDWSAGRITEYNFNMLSEKYQGEQRELDAKIKRLHEAMEVAAQTAVDAEKWIGLMKQYVNPTELTAELLNTLIEKILVHEAVKSEDGSREQEVEIFYRFIGKIE